MPKWMHDRAEHILAKNPSMPKSEAFAIATQQMHSLGKSPKSYGTIHGRVEAAEKYKTPEDDKTASATPFAPSPDVLTQARKSMESFLESKGFPKDHPHALLAGASMYAQGYRPGLKDIDVYVPGLKEHVQEVHNGLEVDAHGTMENLEKGFSSKVLEDRVQHGGLQLMILPHTLKMKQLLNREKDQSDIELLQKHLVKVSHKLQGQLEYQGLPVVIENRKGSVRKGVGDDGVPWKTKMLLDYGYIKGTEGKDGEEVDTYVGPVEDAPNAYVVHQHKENGKGFDEDKVMLGLSSKAEAIKAYLAHYDDPKFLGPVSVVPVERLKELVDEGKPLDKISSGQPWHVRAVDAVTHWATTPKVPSVGAPGLTGLNRWKQLIGGHRVKDIYNEYEAADPEVKSKLMAALTKEDAAAMRARIGTFLGVAAGGALAGREASKAIGRSGRWVGQKIMSSKATEEEKEKGPREALRASLDRFGVKSEGAKDVGERLLLKGEHTKKITADDTLGTTGNLASAGLVGALTVKPGLEHVLGAQSFYHGTDVDSAKKILQEGIDPKFGGRVGGAAWKQQQRAIEAKELRDAGLHTLANEKVPKQHLFSLGKDVPMGHIPFVENAEGRTYNVPGAPGHISAGVYGVMQNPKLQQQWKDSAEEMNRLRREGKPIRAAWNAYKGMFKNIKDTLFPSGDSSIVAGVLPHEEFHAKFEPDPDDITKFQLGYRAKRPDIKGATSEIVKAENLSKNTPTIQNIIRNRSKQWFTYAKKHPGRIASGLGLLALPVALGGYQAAKSTHRLVQKIRNKYEVDPKYEKAPDTTTPLPDIDPQHTVTSKSKLSSIQMLAMRHAFEKKKEVENKKAWSIPQPRKGTRPMRVDTLLRKENDGTLGGYKLAMALIKLSDASGATVGSSVPFSARMDERPVPSKPAVKGPNYVPSADDPATPVVKREEGLSNVHTQLAPGVVLSDIATSSSTGFGR